MAYNDERSVRSSHLLLDLETAPLANALDFCDPVEAAKNLRDPAKIAADLAQKAVDQRDKAGIDWNLARIVCLGLWTGEPSQGDPRVLICRDEDEERAALVLLADLLRSRVRARPRLLGFRLRTFDAPMLLQRARYLDVPMPTISLKRWENPHLTDLYDLLTFDDQPATSIMRRSLDSFCRRFGIAVTDAHRGSDVAALIALNDYERVADHCRADLRRTAALARRLGILAQLPEPAVTRIASTETVSGF